MTTSDSRSRILDTATEMFNTQGVAATTTAQIANALGMRPSNLYYYFGNKEHIILTIWQERISPAIAPLFEMDELSVSAEAILGFFIEYCRRITGFRFFYQEMYSVLVTCPELNKLYREWADKQLARTVSCMESWVKVGIMRQASSAQLLMIAENMWAIGQSHTAYMRLGKPELTDEELTRSSVAHTYAVLYPNLTDSAVAKIASLLESNSSDEEYAMFRAVFER